jgi:hypothetical protein
MLFLTMLSPLLLLALLLVVSPEELPRAQYSDEEEESGEAAEGARNLVALIVRLKCGVKKEAET